MPQPFIPSLLRFLRRSSGQTADEPVIPQGAPASLPTPDKVAIILNPVSGTAHPARRRERILAAARHYGWMGEIWETRKESGASPLIKQALRRGYRHIVICGGDGSVMEALNAIAGTDAVLGIVPSGTGNQLASNLKLPSRTQAAMEVALHGVPTAIDIGCANKKYFGFIAGIGWDAAFLRDASRHLKRRIGLMAYFLAALKNLAHPVGRYMVQVDDRLPEEFSAKSILIANLGIISGYFELVPSATLNNGTLTVAIIRTETVWSWLLFCYNVLRKQTAKETRLLFREGKKIVIRSLSSRQPIEIDGNDFPPARTLSAEVVTGGLRLMLPKEKNTSTVNNK